MATTLVRRIAATTFLCIGTALYGTPLLFINHSAEPTEFARTRANTLALPNEVVVNFTLASLEGKSVVIMPGISSYEPLMLNKPLLTEFVHGGGYLWVNLAGSQCAPDSVPGGAGSEQWNCGSMYHNEETIVDPNHPYFKGGFDPKAVQLTAASFVDWMSTDGGHVIGAPANATALLRNTRGASLVEYAFGQGWVVVSTLGYGWAGGGARGAALDNMLLYASNQVRGSQAEVVPPPTPAGIPEPSTFVLFATGGVLWACARLRLPR